MSCMSNRQYLRRFSYKMYNDTDIFRLSKKSNDTDIFRLSKKSLSDLESSLTINKIKNHLYQQYHH